MPMKMLIALLLTAVIAQAQTRPAPRPTPAPTAAPTTRPASAPASRPASAPVRYVLVMPTGFKSVVVGNHTAVVEPADEPWVRKTLETMTPSTLPSTMPTNIMERLAANRASLKAKMVADLALPDPAVVEKFFKETLEKQLGRYDEIAPPLFYMVTSGPRLKQLVKEGWSNPRFYYNRSADDVSMSRAVNLNSDGPGDDVLIPVFVAPDEALDVKQKRLVDTVRTIEDDLALKISQHSQASTQVAFITFIANEVLEPLKPKPEQEWFGVGASNVLSAKYLSLVNGMDAQALLADMTAELNPRVNPMRPSTVDLVHPTALTEMRPEAIPFYVDAYRRKATRVVSSWSVRAGEGSIAKVLTAMRKQMPPDGPGLVKLVQQVSGIDLTMELAPTP
jgi:hypothetical protein